MTKKLDFAADHRRSLVRYDLRTFKGEKRADSSTEAQNIIRFFQCKESVDRAFISDRTMQADTTVVMVGRRGDWKAMKFVGSDHIVRAIKFAETYNLA